MTPEELTALYNELSDLNDTLTDCLNKYNKGQTNLEAVILETRDRLVELKKQLSVPLTNIGPRRIRRIRNQAVFRLNTPGLPLH